MTGSIVALVLVAVGLAVVGALLYRGVWRRLGRRFRPLLLLRVSALCIVALLLVRPGFGCHRAATKPTLAILLDTSASMSLPDAPGAKPRITLARQLLSQAKATLALLFSIRTYRFAESLAELPENVTAGGKATNLLQAVSTVARNADAILLISDGNDTSVLAEKPLPREMPPVFSVGIGSRTTAAMRDVAVRLGRLPTRVFAGSSLKVVCEVEAGGFEGVPLRLQLFVDGKERAQKCTTPRRARAKAVFEVRLEEVGTRELSVVVAPQEGELTRNNNRDSAFVQVVESKIRVFYAEGSLRWEYKFLRQVLAADPNVEFVGAVHVGGGEFSLQGASRAITLEGPLPSAEEMEKFDVVIIGDLTRQMLPDTQLAKLEKFVSDGGTLVIIAGEHIISADFRGTPLEALLPVRLGRVGKMGGRFVPRLTEEGKDHPVFEGVGRHLKSGEAALETLYVAGGAKPATVVLAEHPLVRAGAGAAPVLLFHRYGGGRVAAVMSDTFWRWFFRFRALGRNSPYVRFFGQFLRWAAKAEEQTAGPLTITLEPAVARCGQSVRVSVHPNEVVPDSVRAFCENEPLPLKRVGGVLVGVMRRFVPGRYIVRAEGATRDGRTVTAQKRLTVGNPQTEWRRLTLNESLLERLAQHTRGRSVLPPQFPLLLEELKALAEARAGAYTPLWQSPWILLLLFGLLFGEWWLRKRGGLI